jgi:hypothetical protein
MSRPFRAPWDPVPKNPPVRIPICSGSRRGLLGGLAAMAAAPAAAAAMLAHPDVELLAACAAHLKTAAEEARLLEAMRSFDVDDNSPAALAAETAWDAACGQSDIALERVVKLPATTLEGVAAKGRSVLKYWLKMNGPPTPLNYEEEAAEAVLRDLARLARLAGGEA